MHMRSIFQHIIEKKRINQDKQIWIVIQWTQNQQKIIPFQTLFIVLKVSIFTLNILLLARIITFNITIDLLINQLYGLKLFNIIQQSLQIYFYKLDSQISPRIHFCIDKNLLTQHKLYYYLQNNLDNHNQKSLYMLSMNNGIKNQEFLQTQNKMFIISNYLIILQICFYKYHLLQYEMYFIIPMKLIEVHFIWEINSINRLALIQIRSNFKLTEMPFTQQFSIIFIENCQNQFCGSYIRL
ncbi:unnamed protein product [Paramecium sonneborni]|uniref:Transmembrane protein n=1 Tax=Paramecium sonneborni TaxID=65129 RepID=A0A8S1KC64_9CILI|nr:unnamed protein product [Paramecium sonneborni]